MKLKLSNWSKYPVKNSELKYWRGERFVDNKKWIARGLGRCYGDASLSELVYSTVAHNLIYSFDQTNGIICCQSGVSLKEILEIFVPKGWFLPVSPGTKYITVGGALASDVHGKNHHVAGCFGDHVLEFDLILANGKKIRCTPVNNADIFQATRGGMGLTGMIDTVTFKLIRIETSYIKQRQIKAQNLHEAFDLFETYKAHTYSMAWIDCLKGGKYFGRSLMMMGEHALMDELPVKYQTKPLHTGSRHKLNMPVNAPDFVLNPYSVKVFNWLYYHKNFKRTQENIVHYDGFFYPLDSILNWNRMYGKAGFVQYQFVLPVDQSKKGLEIVLSLIRKKGWGSFLSVLKLFGKQESFMSFPMEGYTLALDFPIRKGLFEFLDELDAVIAEMGGRIYLSKDARMRATTFWQTYPNSQKFKAIINKINPNSNIKSDLSHRLGLI